MAQKIDNDTRLRIHNVVRACPVLSNLRFADTSVSPDGRLPSEHIVAEAGDKNVGAIALEGNPGSGKSTYQKALARAIQQVYPHNRHVIATDFTTYLSHVTRRAEEEWQAIPAKELRERASELLRMTIRMFTDRRIVHSEHPSRQSLLLIGEFPGEVGDGTTDRGDGILRDIAHYQRCPSPTKRETVLVSFAPVSQVIDGSAPQRAQGARGGSAKVVRELARTVQVASQATSDSQPLAHSWRITAGPRISRQRRKGLDCAAWKANQLQKDGIKTFYLVHNFHKPQLANRTL